LNEAVVVSVARTPIGKSYRGAFNDTQAQSLAGHAIRHAVERAGVAPEEVDDVVLGCALQRGGHGVLVYRIPARVARLFSVNDRAQPRLDRLALTIADGSSVEASIAGVATHVKRRSEKSTKC
jgi:hypothetical protein